MTRLKSKDLEIDRLSEEKTRLQSEMDFLKEVAWNPTEDAVTASAMFKALKAEFEEQRTDADEAKRLGEVAEKRADELVGNQEGFKAAMEVSNSGSAWRSKLGRAECPLVIIVVLIQPKV